MEVTKQMIPLISAIEFEIGYSCYNADSYNGWTDEYGCSFRYPLTYEVRDTEGVIHTYKTRFSIVDEGITPENIRTACYRFGANELEIGGAVIDVLNLLEARYGLDFNALEKAHQEKKPSRE